MATDHESASRRIRRVVHKSVPLLFVSLFLLESGCGMSAAPRAEAVLKSSNQMKELMLGIANYRDANGKWPDSLAEVKPLVADFDQVMINPVTGDDPGYEYVKPPEDADLATTVILYQLRDGKRDTVLRVGFGNNRVSEIKTGAN